MPPNVWAAHSTAPPTAASRRSATVSCGQPSSRRALLDGREIIYELHRSPRRRKNVSFIVEQQHLRVLAPKRTTLRALDEILQRRTEWILQRLDAQTPPRLRDQIRDGGVLPLLGVSTPVIFGHGPSRLEADHLLVDAAAPDPTSQAEACLRQLARQHFQDRVEHWAPCVDARPQRLQVRDQKTRWGSASARGTLSLNWRLIFATLEIVDYVVVHELCHFHQPNHSAAFWRLIASHLPDYADQRGALRQIEDSLIW